MNIKNNIVNYLFDKDYVICTYEDYVYAFNYIDLEVFSDTRVTLNFLNKKSVINGQNLIIIKITKEEILIKGIIKNIEMVNL